MVIYERVDQRSIVWKEPRHGTKLILGVCRKNDVPFELIPCDQFYYCMTHPLEVFARIAAGFAASLQLLVQEESLLFELEDELDPVSFRAIAFARAFSAAFFAASGRGHTS